MKGDSSLNRESDVLIAVRSLMPIRYALGLGLALAAVIVVGLNSVTLTHERASGQAADVTVSFDMEEMDSAEMGNFEFVTVRLSEVITGTVMIPLMVLDASTAAAGDDYTFPGAVQVEITDADNGRMMVDLVDDDVSESLETVIFGFGELPAGYVGGSPSTLTIKIADNDNTEPTGDVTIGGEAKVGETLMAITSAIEDVDNADDVTTEVENDAVDLEFAYQWQRTNGAFNEEDYEDIEGAISSTYPLTEKDIGEQLTVKVTSTDQYGNGNDTPYDLQVPDETVSVIYNQPKPFIIVGDLVGGRLTTGVELTADTSGMVDDMDDPLAGSYSYEWKRGDVVIADAIAMTYTLVDEDVADRITVTATYTDTDNVDQSATSNPVGPVVSPNAATGNPKISGLGQVGSTLTAVPGDIADVDGGGLASATEYSYTWFHGDDDDYSSPLGSGPTYVLQGRDATKTIKVVASFVDALGDPDSRSSAPTSTIIGSLGKISRIEPGVGRLTVKPGDSVTLSVEIYGVQSKQDQSLGDDLVFTWDQGGRQLASDVGASSIEYTVPSSPTTYTVTASLDAGDCRPGEGVDADEACTAVFTIKVVRPPISTREDETPVNPPGVIPPIISDAEGNPYSVFTPVEGGTFASGEDFSIQAGPGAVQNGEYIGVRMSDDGPASNAGMIDDRYTLAGNFYGVYAADGSGAAISSYVLDEPARVCVPLPVELRQNISALGLVAANSNGSLTVLAGDVSLGSAGMIVCGNLGYLPASVAVGSQGAPGPLPTPVPIVEELPDTGGESPAAVVALMALLLGMVVVVIGGVFVVLGRRRFEL